METDASRRARSGSILVTVLTVTVGLQCLRALFPVAYSYREANGLARTVLIVALVFGAAAVIPLLTRGTPRRTVLLVAIGALAVARLVLQVVGSVGMGLASVTAAIGLTAIVLVVGSRDDGRTASIAVVGGLALDTAQRALWGTWDLSWQHDAAPTAVSVALVVGLVASVLLLPRDESVLSPSGLTALALGPYLALQLLLLQNVAAVAASATVALATATAIVFVADGLGVLAVQATAHRPLPRSLLAVSTIVLAVAAWALTGATGAAFVVLVIVGQVLATTLLARASLRSTVGPSRLVQLLAALAGMATLGATLFLYQLHYDKPLPVSNRWLPVAAALVLGLAAFLTRAERTAPMPLRATRARALALAGALVVVAMAVVIGIAAGEPDLTATRTGARALTVMTFNAHNAVTREGQLDPDRIADVVERADPDVVVIEEAGRGWQLSSTLDLAEWMKRRLGLPYEWAPAADHTMGNLVFSKVPLRDTRVVRLPQGTGTMKRSALIARVGPVVGHDVTVVGVHLQNGSSADRKDTRIDEFDVLLHALGSDRARTVLAGDLNADPGERDLRHVLDAGFTTTQPTRRCTLKTSNDNCVDWILVTDDLAQGSPRVIRVREFDHNALVSTVRVR